MNNRNLTAALTLAAALAAAAVSGANAQQPTMPPHDTQCAAGGERSFTPTGQRFIDASCSPDGPVFSHDCQGLGRILAEQERDIEYLKGELKNPESEEYGIDLWNVNFPRDRIEQEILPKLKKDLEKIKKALEQAESFLHAEPPTNPYNCPAVS